jgi:coenzyme PQQ synthesis protein D (PqqD)
MSTTPYDGPPLPPLDACPKRRLDISAGVIDGEAVVLDRQAGLVHQLNPTASYVWERCDGHSTVADIAHQLAQAFDVDPTVAIHDAQMIIRQMQDSQLLEPA